MTWQPLLALPARWLAPLLLGLLALVAVSVNHHWQVQAQTEAVLYNEQQRLRDRLGLEQTRLEILVGQTNWLQVRRLVSSLGLRDGVTHAWLLDDQGVIQASLRRTELGKPLQDAVIGWEPASREWLLDLTRSERMDVSLFRRPDSRAVIGSVRIQPHHLLLIHLDMDHAVAERLAAERGGMLRSAALIALFMALLAGLLHVLWFRRVEKVRATAQALGAGQLEARAHLQGRDEIAAIGAAIDQMAADIQRRQTEMLRLVELIDHSPVVAFGWRNAPGWPVNYVSTTVSQWGYNQGDFLSGRLHFADLIHPEDLPRIEADVARHLSDGPDEYEQEYRFQHADGHWMWLDDRTWLARDAQGQVTRIQGVLVDISARKHAELSVQQQMQRLSDAEQHARLGSWTFDPHTGQTWWSPQMYALMSQPSSIHPPGPWDYLALIHPDDREPLAQAQRRLEAGEWVEFPAHRTHPDHGPVRWLQPSMRIEKDTLGRAIRVVGTLLDVTDLKQAEIELRKLNASLEARVQDRTAELSALNQSLESFVYSVSHDLKAPLRGVEGYSRMLEEDFADRLDGDGRLFLANIRSGVERMGNLIDDLLAYSRMERRTLTATRLNLQTLVGSILNERAEDLMRQGVEVTNTVPDLAVVADAEGLAMVMRNLVENAIKFSRQASPPRIELGANIVGDQVECWVRDNGIGFDMKYHDRIFEIFQRLHRLEEFPGTGIGLALVKKALQRMGGRVWADSRVGQGACFHIELPLAPSSETTTP